MRKLILFVFLIGMLPAAYAVKVTALYEAEVPVVSQSESLRDQAIQQAFVQTLTKASGSVNFLQSPVIKAALPLAKNNVQELGYIASGIPATPYLLKVKFDPQAIKQLLRQAKAPIWDDHRPLILVWVSVENTTHGFEIMDSESSNEIEALIKKEASQRGLPILFPVMDITDLNQISIADIHTMSVGSLQKAAERYHPDGILIGNIERQEKSIQSHWKLLLGQDHWDWEITQETPHPLIGSLMDKMTATLGNRYAAVHTEDVSSSFRLVVQGVAQQGDFENLMNLIKHISLIKEVEIENIDGEEVIMHLAVQGSQKAFMQDASVGQHLKLQDEKGDQLIYLWVN